MIKFGNPNSFAIIVDYEYSKLKDDPEFMAYTELQRDNYFMGAMYFWVNGKNLFAYDFSDPKATYTNILLYIFQYFTDYIKFHLKDAPFPVKTKATNASDMSDETALFESSEDYVSKILEIDWENLDMELASRISVWNMHHSFLSHNHGTFLPAMFFRKCRNCIEISWSNQKPFKNSYGEFYLKHKKGVEYIDIMAYRNVIAEFCFDFIKRFSFVYPELLDEHRRNLEAALIEFDNHIAKNDVHY